MDAFDYISRLPHFALLPKEELVRVAQSVETAAYPADTHFADQGKTQIDSIYLVTEGALTLYDEREGAKKLAGHIKPGEVFGGISILLNGGVSLRTVEIHEKCAGYKVPKRVFLDLCTRYKAFFEYFLENFSKNIIDPSLSSLIEAGQAQLFLSGCEPFSFLPAQEIERVVAALTVVRYPKGTILFVQGSTRVGYLYIVQRGSAERYFETDKSRTMRELLEEGDVYGGISILLNDGISVRTVRVLEDTCFYLVPKDLFLDLCRRYESFTEFFSDTFGKRMLEKSYASVVAKAMVPREESSQFLNQHVASVYTADAVFGEVSMSIQSAAQMMADSNVSYLLLKDETGACVGVLTEHDLARRVTARGYDIRRPASKVMSSPVKTIPEYALIFEAMMAMMEGDIRHLAVTDVDDAVVGTLTAQDLVAAQGQSPLFLTRRIVEAETIDQIVESKSSLPALIRTLISSGAKAKNITTFITTVSDAILQKVMAFTLDRLGPPPAKFAFMIMGSEGRGEQTLKTDQDNAIVFEDLPPDQEAAARAYFTAFGESACNMLDQAGYDFCTGGVMAKNPKWCQPLATWQAYFSEWIHAARPEDLLQASIFFDFRRGYGDQHLVDTLRAYLFDTLEGWQGFFRHLAENALYFKPPLGFFRNFVVESKGAHRDKFDIKAAMTPIVDFARLMALRYKVEETNTLERLSHLRILEKLTQREYEELEKAYSFLLQVRFVRQISAIVDEKKEPDNFINPKDLTRIEQKMLKEIFVRIEKFQGELEADFIGII